MPTEKTALLTVTNLAVFFLALGSGALIWYFRLLFERKSIPRIVRNQAIILALLVSLLVGWSAGVKVTSANDIAFIIAVGVIIFTGLRILSVPLISRGTALLISIFVSVACGYILQILIVGIWDLVLIAASGFVFYGMFRVFESHWIKERATYQAIRMLHYDVVPREVGRLVSSGEFGSVSTKAMANDTPVAVSAVFNLRTNTFSVLVTLGSDVDFTEFKLKEDLSISPVI